MWRQFIFLFLRSGVEAKSGVEFRLSTRNASKFRRKVRIECLKTRFPLPTLLCACCVPPTIIINVKVYEDLFLLHFYAKTTELI